MDLMTNYENNEEEKTVSFVGKALKLNNADDAKVIVEAIQNCGELLTINLEGNTLGVEAAKEIGKALETKSHLQFGLLKDLFTGRLKTEIPDAIRFLTGGIVLSGAQLKVLDLSDNAFGPVGMPSVLPFLESESCRNLKVLKLNNNGLGIGGGKILAKGLENLISLEIFVCGRNRLENEAAIAIGQSLANITTLLAIEMPQNGIKADGMIELAKAIEANKNLRVVNLNDNNMSGRGGEAVAHALQSLIHLEVVNFGDCLLRRKNCVLVCEALRSSNLANLKQLILNGNEIGGAEVIESLRKLLISNTNKTLKLDLSCNCFGSEGVNEIRTLLEEQLDLALR